MEIALKKVRSTTFIWSLVFIGLNAIDAFTTTALLNINNAGNMEGSPILGMLPGSSLVTVKMLAAVVAIVGITYFIKRPLWVLKALNLGMALVVTWNIAWVIFAIKVNAL